MALKTIQALLDALRVVKNSAKFRLGVTVVIFLVLEGIVVYLASIYGEGPHLFQRVLNSWHFLGIANPAIAVLIG